jgi:hypothetical protein
MESCRGWSEGTTAATEQTPHKEKPPMFACPIDTAKEFAIKMLIENRRRLLNNGNE